MVMSICKLLQNIIANNEVKSVEYIFVFACVWCIGGGFTEKDGKDYRKEFSNWWRDKFKAVRFPGKTVFDYYVDLENPALVEWNNLATNDIVSTIDTSKSISSYTIPTVDTIATQYLMRQFINVKHSPILVGMAGCGKT
jgi:dynein heavy chain